MKLVYLFFSILLSIFLLIHPSSVLAAAQDTRWAKSTGAGGPDRSVFNGVATDSSGNVYAVGRINGTGTYNFGNGITVAGTNAGNDAVIVKYNSSGDAQWAKSTGAGAPATSIFYSVTVDSSGNIYATGTITGTSSFDFGNSVTVSGGNGGVNGVVVSYSSSGTTRWGKINWSRRSRYFNFLWNNS